MFESTIAPRPTADDLRARLAAHGYDGHIVQSGDDEPHLDTIAIYSYAGNPAAFGHALFSIVWVAKRDAEGDVGFYTVSGRPRTARRDHQLRIR